LTASPQSSVNFTPLHALEGIITPNGLCFERHHGGMADIDPARHRLMIHGMVERPVVLTMAEIRRLPRVNRIYFLECAANSGMEWRGAQLNGVQFTHGMIHNVMYTGVTLRTLLEAVGCGPVRRGCWRRGRMRRGWIARSRSARRSMTAWWRSPRTARRCGRSRAIRCAWWCRAAGQHVGEVAAPAQDR
jgi:hypothetical protein